MLLSDYQKIQAETTLQKALDILSSEGDERKNIISAMEQTRFAQSITELMYENRVEERHELSASCMRSAVYKEIDFVIARANKMLAKEIAKEYQALGDQYHHRMEKIKARKAYDQAAYYAKVAIQYSDAPRPIFKRHEGKELERQALKSIEKTTDAAYQEQLRQSILSLQDSDPPSDSTWEELNLENFKNHKLLWQSPPSLDDSALV